MRSYLYAEAAALAFAWGGAEMFALQIRYQAALLTGAALCAPLVVSAIRAERGEHRKFCDCNSYMQQFISAMLLHKRIPAALEDVFVTFPDGPMHETLRHMLVLIRGSVDVETGEQQAFSYMLSQYPNAQLTLIHDFAMRVESRGGEFETEMRLLSAKRGKWEKRTEHCQARMKSTLFSAVILYLSMIAVCAMVQRMMPAELSVLATTAAQAGEVLLLLFFLLFLWRAVGSMASGWMKNETVMGERAARRSLQYLKKWAPGNCKEKGALHRLCLFQRLYGVFLFFRIKKELAFAVGRWLFDVCLLMQKYNITVSVTESLRTAPPILQEEIQALLDKLKSNPSGADAYLSFLGSYRLEHVTTTMRMLIAIQNGTAGDSKLQMEQLIAHNMEMLDEIDAYELEVRDAWNVRYNIYPMIPGAVVMGIYLVSMIVQIFRTMSALV